MVSADAQEGRLVTIMSGPWKRLAWAISAAALSALVPAVQAHAVSDGNYNNKKQGCTGNAFNSNSPKRTEPHCYIATWQLSDGTHNYVTVGIPMTADGQNPNALELCVDLGAGTRQCAMLDRKGITPEKAQKGTAPNPASGLHFYFGMNDNIDVGEHDSSSQVNNGPSDGGGLQLNADPQTAAQWVAALQAQNAGYILTHPLPVGDAGTGFCADGFCFSAQTQRRTIMHGGNHKKHRDVSNYDGKKWDPESCAGPSDSPKDCGGKSLKAWNNQEGTVYAEPGIQIYEDPDPQGSPIGPSYPIPAVYVGTCGLIVGGGQMTMPSSPFTNKAGQFVVSTGC
jgi:hypothetical protein